MKLEHMEAIAIRMQGQDQRMTSDPIYMVEECIEHKDKIVYESVQPFFSSHAAELFIIQNHHNLQSPRVYIMSGHNNPEWKTVRAFLKTLQDTP